MGVSVRRHERKGGWTISQMMLCYVGTEKIQYAVWLRELLYVQLQRAAELTGNLFFISQGQHSKLERDE
jgi:hypothetical protein